MASFKKVLLTGGGGFIGRNIFEQLDQDYRVESPSSTELNLLDSASVENYFQTQHFDVVIHAAALGVSRRRKDQEDIFSTNTEMFINLQRNSFAFDRLLNLGSGAEYDKSRNLIKVKENEFGLYQPKDDYGRAKYFISQKIGGLENFISFRCFGVFGKYEDYTTRFISNAICRSLAGLPIILNQNRVFDYVFVDDLVKIIKYFIINKPVEKFYNISSSQQVELLYLAELIKTATNNPYEIEVKVPGLGLEYSGDNALLMKELVNVKFTSYPEAIAQMVAWYKQNWEKIDKAELSFDA